MIDSECHLGDSGWCMGVGWGATAAFSGRLWPALAESTRPAKKHQSRTGGWKNAWRVTAQGYSRRRSALAAGRHPQCSIRQPQCSIRRLPSHKAERRRWRKARQSRNDGQCQTEQGYESRRSSRDANAPRIHQRGSAGTRKTGQRRCPTSVSLMGVVPVHKHPLWPRSKRPSTSIAPRQTSPSYSQPLSSWPATSSPSSCPSDISRRHR